MKWQTLEHDVDRALEVHRIHMAGLSFRELAKELPCSATQLRNLYWAAKAPAGDLALAREGKISIRELVRRSKDSKKKREAEKQIHREQARKLEAEKGSKLICKWLEENGLIRLGERVVEEARGTLVRAMFDGSLSRIEKFPGNLSVAEIIERSRPEKALYASAIEAVWYAEWLALWTFQAFPDLLTCHKALNIALATQIEGTPCESPKRVRKS
jgi:hypothetical protein